MKNSVIHIGMIAMFFVLSGLLSNCGKRELCEFSHPHRGRFVFAFDWRHLFPDVVMPGKMVMHFYSETRDTLIRHVLLNEKGSLMLPADNYKLLLFHEDITLLELQGTENLHTAQVIHPCGTDGVVSSAEPFYVCVAGSLMVEPDGEIHNTFIMQRYSQKISFALQINGLFNPVMCSGELGGLVGSGLLATRENVDASAPVRAVFPLTVEGNKVSGMLYVLGMKGTNLLTLNFTAPDSRSYSVGVDITEALGKMVNGEIDISLLIEGDEVSGIKASVTAWKTGDEITVVMP